MTIDEAVNTWMPVVAMGVEDMPEIKEAVRMSIASLEALEEIRQEAVDAIEDSLYVRNTRILDIIDRHLQEVTEC